LIDVPKTNYSPGQLWCPFPNLSPTEGGGPRKKPSAETKQKKVSKYQQQSGVNICAFQKKSNAGVSVYPWRGAFEHLFEKTNFSLALNRSYKR